MATLERKTRLRFEDGEIEVLRDALHANGLNPIFESVRAAMTAVVDPTADKPNFVINYVRSGRTVTPEIVDAMAASLPRRREILLTLEKALGDHSAPVRELIDAHDRAIEEVSKLRDQVQQA